MLIMLGTSSWLQGCVLGGVDGVGGFHSLIACFGWDYVPVPAHLVRVQGLV